MRLSTSTNIMSSDEWKNHAVSIEESVKACAEAGYRNLDANFCGCLRGNNPLSRDGWESWARNLRELAGSLGVNFTQSHGYFESGGNSLDIHGRRRDPNFDEWVRRSILASEIAGVNWMVLHPTLWPDSDGHADYKKSFQYNRDYFAEWGEFAAKHNVGIAVENMLNAPGGIIRYCVRAEELIELVDALNDRMIKICIDTGHVHLSRLNLPNFIRAVGGRLRATHIADNHRNEDEHIAPFQGTINWREVMAALKEINYGLDFAFEIQHLSSRFPASTQKSLVKFSHDLGEFLLSL